MYEKLLQDLMARRGQWGALAKFAGVSRSTVSRIARGKVQAQAHTFVALRKACRKVKI